MSSPYYAEIRMLPFTFTPRDWADCAGQVMQVQQNPALFALLSNLYGGNGQTTFGLPDLRARAPLHVGGLTGQKPPLSAHRLGDAYGSLTETLSTQQVPNHTHSVSAVQTAAGNIVDTASNTTYLSNSPGNASYMPNFNGTNAVPLNLATIGISGGQNGVAQPHENRQPFLALRFCICIEGMFPARN